jgi:hypothetical protein
MKADLAAFYDGARTHTAAAMAAQASQPTGRISGTSYRRRFSRTPY